MSQPTPEQVALADEMGAQARNIARAWIEMCEMDLGESLANTPGQEELLNVGIEAGYIGALQMLQKRGILPGLDQPRDRP